MKALLILDDDKAIEAIDGFLRTHHFETITYRWFLKALDNLEEISPDLVIISVKDYPRHWKTLAGFIKSGIAGKQCSMILFSPHPLSNDEKEKARALGVSGLLYSYDNEGLAGLKKILEACGIKYIPESVYKNVNTNLSIQRSIDENDYTEKATQKNIDNFVNTKTNKNPNTEKKHENSHTKIADENVVINIIDENLATKMKYDFANEHNESDEVPTVSDLLNENFENSKTSEDCGLLSKVKTIGNETIADKKIDEKAKCDSLLVNNENGTFVTGSFSESEKNISFFPDSTSMLENFLSDAESISIVKSKNNEVQKESVMISKIGMPLSLLKNENV